MSLGVCILFIILGALIGACVGFGAGLAWYIERINEHQ